MTDPVTEKLVEILLVEDNPADVRLTLEALKDGKVKKHLSVVGDGVEAMAFLHRKGPYTEAPHPDLILLDLNLPKKDGREVLAEIKADDALKRIPVVVLTTSTKKEDVLKTYELHANCYAHKAINLDEFIRVLRSIEDFWFTVVKLPESNGPDS